MEHIHPISFREADAVKTPTPYRTNKNIRISSGRLLPGQALEWRMAPRFPRQSIMHWWHNHGRIRAKKNAQGVWFLYLDTQGDFNRRKPEPEMPETPVPNPMPDWAKD